MTFPPPPPKSEKPKIYVKSGKFKIQFETPLPPTKSGKNILTVIFWKCWPLDLLPPLYGKFPDYARIFSTEGIPKLNLKLKSRCLKGNFKTITIGSLFNLTFSSITLSSNIQILKSLVEGNNLFCQESNHVSRLIS